MTTSHKIYAGGAHDMSSIDDGSVALVATSPPYPMIAMWDDIMSLQNADIGDALKNENGSEAFELMHVELDAVWREIDRILLPGGFACINIGDATRTIGGEFQLYPNHSRIISAFANIGIPNLPNILWRKQTNAPNKFMGSGMLPSGAYVTLEHEWILIFRKGGKRIFKSAEDKLRRQQSAFFWEERNNWFSDLWDLKGTKQSLAKSDSRSRSAAYPFEIPHRLIQMYSLYGDIVVDPFGGTGTTAIASIASGRDSISYDIDSAFTKMMSDNIEAMGLDFYEKVINQRIISHKEFISKREADPKKSPIKYYNDNIQEKVMTKQELNMKLLKPVSIDKLKDTFEVTYKDI